ncbi:MAG: 16S rRNA (cytosine(1402)-N(4))-methyltransferase RsmH [Ignavibacteriaceae bacterium]|nr:16S rRNA (cytosine(1402)-N(4))-methyltransferase RsmH [Ignavibacteriaceae bacterium]MCW9094706.1 16S rRNA (cytosine(1402)-N(4))-methyltransferase RsmH [Ignavibacteriaceae bacterium]
MTRTHIPVLLEESIDYLVTKTNGVYFEATLGFGGHTEKILSRLGKKGSIVSTDVDQYAFDYCKNKFNNEDRIKLYNFNFSLIDVIAKIESLEFFDGVLADIGVSSYQLDNAAAGFSYSTKSELDLRLDKNLQKTAADFINNESEDTIAKIIFEYGEEKNSRKIARKISEFRKINRIETTDELKEIISLVTNPRYLTKTLSRVFQALRIHVNDELAVLKSFLENAVSVLAKGGRLVVISYHSLEDRIVKEFFKYENLTCVCPPDAPICTCGKVKRLNIITRKPIAPSEIEKQNNKRARSAKLRVAERV